MDPLLLGLVVGVSTVVMLFSGIPIAFGLCFISVVFLVIAEGFSILNVFAEKVPNGQKLIDMALAVK